MEHSTRLVQALVEPVWNFDLDPTFFNAVNRVHGVDKWFEEESGHDSQTCTDAIAQSKTPKNEYKESITADILERTCHLLPVRITFGVSVQGLHSHRDILLGVCLAIETELVDRLLKD